VSGPPDPVRLSCRSARVPAAMGTIAIERPAERIALHVDEPEKLVALLSGQP